MGAIVVWRQERKCWEVRHYEGGLRKRKTFRGDDGEKRAREFAEACEVEQEASEDWLREVAIDRACRAWLATYRPALSKSYQATAQGLIEKHIAPFFGSRSLARIGPDDALRFAQVTFDKGRSPATVRNALSLMRRVAQLHVEAGVLTSNPLANVGRLVSQVERAQAREVREVDAWTAEEVEKILATAKRCRPWIYPVLVFLFYTGARRGEALGLTWADVDFSRGLVRIRRARVRGEEKTTKSGKAREVPIGAAGPLLEEVLRGLSKGRLGDAKTTQLRRARHVFTTTHGRPIDEANLSRAWRSVRRRFEREVRPLRLHDARHTFASIAIESGVSVVRVASWLGHASPETTLRVYAHVMPQETPGRGFLTLGRSPGTDRLPNSSPNVV